MCVNFAYFDLIRAVYFVGPFAYLQMRPLECTRQLNDRRMHVCDQLVGGRGKRQRRRHKAVASVFRVKG